MNTPAIGKKVTVNRKCKKWLNKRQATELYNTLHNTIEGIKRLRMISLKCYTGGNCYLDVARQKVKVLEEFNSILAGIIGGGN